jgi:hypothetical protein
VTPQQKQDEKGELTSNKSLMKFVTMLITQLLKPIKIVNEEE